VGGPSRGYHVQQFDTLYLDLYSTAAFVGVVDSDAMLVSPVSEANFFDERGRPRVIPRVEEPWGDLWIGAAKAANFFVGKPCPFRCMSHFPVLLRREHYGAMRTHIETLHGKGLGLVYNDAMSLAGVGGEYYR